MSKLRSQVAKCNRRFCYLILAEMLFTLPAAKEMLPLSALFAGKYREVGIATGIPQSMAPNDRRPDRRFSVVMFDLLSDLKNADRAGWPSENLFTHVPERFSPVAQNLTPSLRSVPTLITSSCRLSASSKMEILWSGCC
jgi:hypothetical protein